MVENRENEISASQILLKQRKHVFKKKRRQNIDDEATANEEDVSGVVEDEVSANKGGDRNESDSRSDEPPEGNCTRHIRPCTCDLTESAKRRVAEFQKAKAALRQKFIIRKAEIEEELKQKELERLEREREKAEQKELFGDEYETTEEGQRKRKKRSARRVSMVSLGVRQVINWKREPKVAVKYNLSWKLRHDNTRYCTKKFDLGPCPEEIDWKSEPAIPVRLTIGSKLRRNVNLLIKAMWMNAKDKRPPFVVQSIL